MSPAVSTSNPDKSTLDVTKSKLSILVLCITSEIFFVPFKTAYTVCSEFYSNFSESGPFTLEHPSGLLKIDYEVNYKNDMIEDIKATTTRNARLIMSGSVFVKKSLL